MTSLLERLLPAQVQEEGRSLLGLPFQQFVDYFNFNGNLYPLAFTQSIASNREEIRGDFTGFVQSAYKANGIVFACMAARALHFSEARFIFRQRVQGRAGKLFGTGDLALLETPWPNGTTSDLLSWMIQDADLAGNSYIVNRGSYLARLRPDWVSILLASRTDRPDWVPGDPDTEIVAYAYKPGGRASQAPEMLFGVKEVAHFAPFKDPQASYRGMSWLTPLIREIQADGLMTDHRMKFMENGATVNLVVKVPATTLEAFNEWKNAIESNHRGVENAYRPMYLGGGADVTPVGANLEQIDFKAVQGAGEVRIAAAARVPPTLLGISEGLQGSTLNAGNYNSARRNMADGLLRPMWRKACGALASITNVPGGAELWYDERDIAFLKEDLKDAAQARQEDAATMRTLVDAGWLPDSVAGAVQADDWSLLKHSGLVPVQLQAPPSQYPTNGTQTTNGSVNGAGALAPTP